MPFGAYSVGRKQQQKMHISKISKNYGKSVEGANQKKSWGQNILGRRKNTLRIYDGEELGSFEDLKEYWRIREGMRSKR